MNLFQQLVHMCQKHPSLEGPTKTLLEEVRKLHKDDKVGEQENTLSISPNAIQAFKSVLLPQLEMQSDPSQSKDIIMSLGSSKHSELENALIVHKPVSMNAGNFYEDIKAVYQNWRK